MQVKIVPLQKKDFKKAIRYAITGMHFDWYLENRFLLNLYGRYFWYSELGRATQVIAISADGNFAGVLLADIEGEERQYQTLGRSLYVSIFELFQKLFSKEGAGVYHETNQELLAQYRKEHTPDGEITFFAVDPERKGMGLGSVLLSELERRASGKQLYLFTDDACTYQFYEHKGFARACERDVVLEFGFKQVPLKCLLYSKTIED